MWTNLFVQILTEAQTIEIKICILIPHYVFVAGARVGKRVLHVPDRLSKALDGGATKKSLNCFHKDIPIRLIMVPGPYTLPPLACNAANEKTREVDGCKHGIYESFGPSGKRFALARAFLWAKDRP